MGQIPANPGNVPCLRFMHVINLPEQLYLPLSNVLSMRTEYLLKYSQKHWGQRMGSREEGRKPGSRRILLFQVSPSPIIWPLFSDWLMPWVKVVTWAPCNLLSCPWCSSSLEHQENMLKHTTQNLVSRTELCSKDLTSETYLKGSSSCMPS